jgi:carboxymethylenebutenolidase
MRKVSGQPLERPTRSARDRPAGRAPRPTPGRVGRPGGFRQRHAADILRATGGPMERKQASDFDQELLNLFDKYVHGDIDRRGFLDRAARYAVGGVTAMMLLDQLNPKFAEAEVIPKDDKRLTTSTIEIDSPKGNGKIKAYFVRPASAKGKLPGVLVVHENRGLNPHIEDIARRIALEGFEALAPDALTTAGGYPGDEDKARELFDKLDRTKTREDFIAAAAALKARPDCTGKIGVVGFCWGGGMTNFLATQLPDLAAAVPFYGAQPKAEEVAHIKAPMLLHYAGNDDRIDAGIPAFEEALKANKVKYQLFKYDGTQHGFNNDTTPRFDKTAAALAWKRTIDFFKKNLK